MNALDLAAATCATALGVSRAEFGRRVDTARKAGCRGLDAVRAAYLGIRDPDYRRHSRAGRPSRDPIDSAIWRDSPRVERAEARSLQSALSRTGGAWVDGRPSKTPKPKRDLAAETLRAAGLALHPGDGRRDREARDRIRRGLDGGQLGFGGDGWGAPA